MDRMISCPACHGDTWRKLHPWSMLEKCTCDHGRIPDRRDLTANDRAVDVIKAQIADATLANKGKRSPASRAYMQAYTEVHNLIQSIREEAERG